MLTADIDLYLAVRGSSDLAARSVAHHRHLLTRAAAFLVARGHRRWSTVTAGDLDDFVADLADQGLKRSTRDSFAWSLRIFGAWLVERGLVLRNPAEDIRVLDDDETPLPPAPLSEEQVAALFDSVPRRDAVDLRLRLHLELLYSCGLRNAEAVALDVSDLDLGQRTVLVRNGKGGRSRMLPALKGILTAASEYLTVRRELVCGPDHGALLLDPNGKRLPAWWVQRWMQTASRDLGFRVFPHLLRHSIAVHLLRRGLDIRNVQQFLGHADLETTGIYLRLVPGHLREDYDRAMPTLWDEQRPPTDEPPPEAPATVTA